MKKEQLLDDIYKHHILGHVVAYVYIIEFQKHELPHLHLLVVLDEINRLRTSAEIDLCISAQWPDPRNQPLLFKTMKLTMIHGPCSNLNLSAPCMQNSRCTKGFPKAFQDTVYDPQWLPIVCMS